MISVVIPAFNEEKTIASCLAALVRQTIKEPFEVIVVDNGSVDATAQVAQTFAAQLNLKIISEPCKGRGPARHTGFATAQGEIICSTDADTVVSPTWLETMAIPLLKGGFVAMAGPARIEDCSWIVNKLFNVIQPTAAFFYRCLFGHYWLPGFNFAIVTSAYLRAGGFDPAMDGLEDNDLSWRVKNVGPISFVRSGAVTFSGRRFHNRFWGGLAEHLSAFVEYYIFGNRRITWSDIR